MSIFDFWKRKNGTKISLLQTSNEVEEYDEEKEERKQLAKQKTALLRERMALDIENLRLEAQARKVDLQSTLEEKRLDLEIKRMEMENLRRERMEDLLPDNEEGGETPETMLMKIIATAMLGKVAPHTGVQQPAIFPTEAPRMPDGTSPQVSEISYEEIRQTWASLSPIAQKAAKQMSDDQIKEWTIQQVPTASPESIKRVVEVVRSA